MTSSVFLPFLTCLPTMSNDFTLQYLGAILNPLPTLISDIIYNSIIVGYLNSGFNYLITNTTVHCCESKYPTLEEP